MSDKKIGFVKGLSVGMTIVLSALAAITLAAAAVYAMGYYLPDVKVMTGSSDGLPLKDTLDGVFQNGIVYLTLLFIIVLALRVVAYIGGYNSGLDEVKETNSSVRDCGQPFDYDSALTRVRATAASMRARAEDNPNGIQAGTLQMFADELDMAVKNVGKQ